MLGMGKIMPHLNARNQKTDLLRGIGVLLVLLHHFHIAYKISSNDFINTFINNRYYGITLLFVASGFLITTKSIERYGTLGNIWF